MPDVVPVGNPAVSVRMKAPPTRPGAQLSPGLAPRTDTALLRPGTPALASGFTAGIVDQKQAKKEIMMNFLAVNELKSPRRLRQRLRQEKELLLTTSGKPTAVILSIDPGEDPEDLLQATREARSRLALSRVRAAAHQAGNDRMTDEQVDALVRRARAERKARP